MPAWLTLKLGGMIFGAVAVIGFVLLAFHWKAQATDRKEKLEIICKVTRDAADNPKMNCGNVTLQIGELGASVKNTKAALERQNAAVAALGKASKQQKAEAAEASRKAEKRAQGAEATADRLIASSRAGARLGESCKASRAVEEAWQ